MQTLNTYKRRLLSLIFITAICGGCGFGDGLGLATVQGTVTLDGEPLSDARVIFHPAAGGRPSNAITDVDGSYELLYIEGQMGALPGKHKVFVSTLVEADPDAPDKVAKMGQRERLPASYNTQTTLEAELASGRRETLDFDLKSSHKP